jgi:uncharacterized protein YndB with AHSA1/START domain
MIVGAKSSGFGGRVMPDQLTVRWTVTIDRSAGEVFDYLADFSRHGEWSPKAFRTEGLAPGPVTQGMSFVTYGAIPGDKEHRNEVEITDVQRPSRLAFLAIEPNGEVFVNTFSVTGAGSGCQVERTWEFPKPTGVMGVAFPLFLRAYVRPQGQKNLDKLKHALETS